jgi:hypothetical protein
MQDEVSLGTQSLLQGLIVRRVPTPQCSLPFLDHNVDATAHVTSAAFASVGLLLKIGLLYINPKKF